MPEPTCPQCREPLPDGGPCPVCEVLGAGDRGKKASEAAPIALSTLAGQTQPKDMSGEESAREAPAAESTTQSSTDEEKFFAELERVKEDGLAAVLIFGFRTAGKTWLLDRMKYELFQGHQGAPTNCEPPFEPVPDKGKTLPGSSRLEFHRVFSKPKPFVLIDIPGETAEALLKGNYEDLRMLLSAMDYASAMIVALPADILFFGHFLPKSNEELFAPTRARGGAARATKTRLGKAQTEWATALRTDNHRVEEFATGLFGAASLLSYLRTQRIDPSNSAQFASVTKADIVSHMGQDSHQPIGGREGVDCPTFFALTKADRVLGILAKDETDPRLLTLNAEFLKRDDGKVFRHIASKRKLQEIADAWLSHPWEIVRRLRPSLHRQLISAFPLGRFDYVTAFYGHDRSTTIAPDHYHSHPQHGVYEILSWISEARKLRRRKRWRLLHFRLAAAAERYLAGYRRSGSLDMGSEGN